MKLINKQIRMEKEINNNPISKEESKFEENKDPKEEQKSPFEDFILKKSKLHSVSVSARIKPLSTKEPPTPPSLGLIEKDKWTSNRITVTIPTGAVKRFDFCDSVIRPMDDQATTFKMVLKPALLGAFLDGFDCTLFAYGQTGSGKTHTMFGPTGSFSEAAMNTGEKDDLGTPSTWGLFPRTMNYLIEYLKAKNIKSEIWVTAVELYCEAPYDLFNSRKPIGISEREDLARRKSVEQDWMRGTFLNSRSLTEFAFEGAKEVKIGNIEDVAMLVRVIEATRVAHGTQMNDRSSRSHCVVTINLSTKNTKKSKFMFVDLAGSERLEKSGSEGMRKLEQITVNFSLTTLGRCIIAKSEGARYIPRRESSLTMAMAHSFAGKTYTSMIVTLAQEPEHADECRASMFFAQNAAKVVNKPKKGGQG